MFLQGTVHTLYTYKNNPQSVGIFFKVEVLTHVFKRSYVAMIVLLMQVAIKNATWILVEDVR